MTANAAHQTDPLARLGQQIVAAAEVRWHRRRRRRTVLTVGATTLALSGAIGVAALQDDIVGPTLPALEPLFAQYENERIDMQVDEGLDKTWRTTVYRNVSAGLCFAAPTTTVRTARVQCGSANVTAEELRSVPVNSTLATIVQSGDGVDTVLVTGIARPDVERVGFPSQNGETVERAIDGKTLHVPIHLDQPDGDMLTVRPFAVLATAPAGSKTMPMVVHSNAGGGYVAKVRVEPAAEATP